MVDNIWEESSKLQPNEIEVEANGEGQSLSHF
jgi:hypothetical protein